VRALSIACGGLHLVLLARQLNVVYVLPPTTVPSQNRPGPAAARRAPPVEHRRPHVGPGRSAASGWPPNAVAYDSTLLSPAWAPSAVQGLPIASTWVSVLR
jgi:hypothetical protein